MLLCAAGMVSALIAEDEPEDVKLIDDAILSTAANVSHHHQDNTASVDKRRRRSAPSDAAVDSRRRHPLLPRTSVLDVLLVYSDNFSAAPGFLMAISWLDLQVFGLCGVGVGGGA